MVQVHFTSSTRFLLAKLKVEACADNSEIADAVDVPKPQVFNACRHSLAELMLDTNSIDEPCRGIALACTPLRKANHVGTAVHLRAHNAKTSRGIDKKARLDQHTVTAADCGQPIDRAACVEQHARADKSLRHADVCKRYIGLNTVDELLRLPVVADLTSSHGTLGITRPTIAQVHAAVVALPNGRIVVGPVDARRPETFVSGCRDRWYKRANERNQRNNAAAEGSHVRVLPQVRWYPHTGQRTKSTVVRRTCDGCRVGMVRRSNPGAVRQTQPVINKRITSMRYGLPRFFATRAFLWCCEHNGTRIRLRGPFAE